MDSEKKRIRNKKIIIVFLCVAIAVAALFGLTFTRFTTDGIEGKVEYEPALFNTVLLGELTSADIAKLEADTTSSDYYTVTVYKCSNTACNAEITCTGGNTCTYCPYCGAINTDFTSQTYTQSLHGAKMSYSLDLSSATEFASTGVIPVEPGTEKTFRFTVTNGTTVADSTSVAKQVENVAECDIKYTLHIKTENNLDLEYTLKDLDTGITYNLVDKNATTVVTRETDPEDQTTVYEVTTKTKGAYSDYVVTTDASTSDFANGARILRLQDDGSITVHRYELTIKWPVTVATATKQKVEPSTELTTETVTKMNNDSSKMKELENIEVLLEVESFVYSKTKSAASDLSADGAAVLSTTPVKDEFYNLEKETVSGGTTTYTPVTVYVSTEASLDAFEDVASADKLPQAAFSCDYSYDLHLYNYEFIDATWVQDDTSKKDYEDPQKGVSDSRGENGQTPNDGHYEYTGTCTGGDYHVILAVPSGKYRTNDSKIDWADTTDHEYYLIYNGVAYKGSLTDEVIRTEMVTYDAKRSPDPYVDEEVVVYKALRFYDSDNNELVLNFSSSSMQEEIVTFYRSSDFSYEKDKYADEYRIFMDKVQ